MRREHQQASPTINGIPAFDEINNAYPNQMKKLLWNSSVTTDGLLYFFVTTSSSWTSTVRFVVCNRTNIIFSQNIALRGSYGNYGAVYDGHVGIFTNDSNYGYYCYTYYYDISNNTLSADRKISTGRNWYWQNAYAYERNGIYYIVGTFNNSSRGPTTVNMTNGNIYVNEFSNPKDDAFFFYNNYTDASYPFLAIKGARYSDGQQNFCIKKWPSTYGIVHSSGVVLSNGISNSIESTQIWPIPYYNIPGRFEGYATANAKLVGINSSCTTIYLSSASFPSAYIPYYQILLSDGTGYYCDPSYNYQRYTISDYLN